MLHRGGEHRGADGLGVIREKDEKERGKETMRCGREEGGGGRRGDVEVKRAIKYIRTL